jgi:hypothetical protein
MGPVQGPIRLRSLVKERFQVSSGNERRIVAVLGAPWIRSRQMFVVLFLGEGFAVYRPQPKAAKNSSKMH